MSCRVVVVVFTIFILSVSTIHGSRARKRNATQSKEVANSSSFSIVPSYSYQYHSNDLNDIGKGDGDFTPSAFNSGSNNQQIGTVRADSNHGVAHSRAEQAYYPAVQDNYAVPDQSSSYAVQPADSYAPPQSDYANPGPSEGYYAPNPVPSNDYLPAPAPSYGYSPSPIPAPAPAPSVSYGHAQSKGYGYGYGAGGFGGGDGGLGVHGGDFAPPPPIKGSIDYVLIPLILIGIAGPIFVVLYVVLGAFEAKLSPIPVRSLSQSWSEVFTSSFRTLQPATELLFNSIDRGLTQYDCMDRAICHVGSYGHDLGFEKLAYFEPFAGVFGLGENGKRRIELLFSTLKRKPASCYSIECPNKEQEQEQSANKTRKNE